ncbi:MAG: insulinase family protein, partial [Verrucomicrobia bacterium]|nr:insulinase family protein [Verrucomicrobiota bacterium]
MPATCGQALRPAGGLEARRTPGARRCFTLPRPGHRFVLLLIAGLGLSLASRACASPWPPVETDLPVHPSLHSGTLPNGVRYLFYPNDQPRERVSLRLLVAVGAAHERDDEVGLAHFIEHMAYRGTRRYPAGSLTAALQRLGVGIGPDSSAFTFYEYTVYHLELPDGTDATLREGLRVFREYAEGITFATEGIETERGVVLSELATRDTPQQRAQFANQRFLWPDSQFAARPIGGTTTSLRSFRREHFQAFYDAWYRPERLAVVVVGPINPPAVASLLAAELGSLASRAPAREEPSAITPERAHRPDVDIFADPGLIGAQISFQHPRRVERTPDSHARRVELLHLGLAFAMFQERLQRLAQAPGASFVTPLAQLSTPFRDWQLATFSVATRIDNWKAAFREVEQEHRRVYLHGFT